VALGFVLIFKASGVFNFAQGAMVLFAALAMARFAEWIPQWTGIQSLLFANLCAFALAGALMFVLAWRGLLVIILVAMALNLLLNPTFALMPLLVTKHFNGGAAELAALEAAMGIGVIVGGIGLGVWGGFKRRILTAMAGLITMGAGVLLVGMAPGSLIAVAIAGMFIAGLANPITNGSIGAIMQTIIPPNMQGRVFSLIGTGSMIASPLGLILAGPLSDLTGIRMWYWIAGAACIVLALMCSLIPSIMNIETHKPETISAN
jgi:DHA3 family macrolide efflux protein-like MFS transporter